MHFHTDILQNVKDGACFSSTFTATPYMGFNSESLQAIRALYSTLRIPTDHHPLTPNPKVGIYFLYAEFLTILTYKLDLIII